MQNDDQMSNWLGVGHKADHETSCILYKIRGVAGQHPGMIISDNRSDTCWAGIQIDNAGCHGIQKVTLWGQPEWILLLKILLFFTCFYTSGGAGVLNQQSWKLENVFRQEDAWIFFHFPDCGRGVKG